jgi:mannan endo-1,4-beta-mannosidase
MRGYPGDDIIDMLSIDMYDRGEQFGPELDTALGLITKEEGVGNRLTAMSETGGRKGLNNWWTSVLLPVVSKYPVGYVLTWRNTYKSKYSVSGNPVSFADDFRNFYKSPRTLFLKEINDADIYKRK